MAVFKLNVSDLPDRIPEIRCGDRVYLSGIIYTARDAAHKKICTLLEQSLALPFDLKNACIYYAGPTPEPPGRTIDGAYAAVTNHDVTICLMPGEYASPGGKGADGQDYPDFRVHYVGPYGKEKTIIDGGAERLFFGCSSAFTSVEGCTIRNMRGRVNRPRFFGLYLYDCAVDISGGSTGYGFASCVIEKCYIYGTAYFASDSSRIFSGFFMQCDVFDTVVDITPTTEAGRTPSMIYASYLENVFIRTNGAVRNFGAASDPYTSVLGNHISMKDCTIICAESTDSFNVPPSVGCLLGLGNDSYTPTYATVTGSVCTNTAALASAIQSDFRPAVTDWRFRYAGYESAAERATRDSMENSIVDALLKNENLNISPAATMSLLSIMADNEAANLPRVANRGTNSIPVGTKIELPPDPEE